jgi:hypothetical protein
MQVLRFVRRERVLVDPVHPTSLFQPKLFVARSLTEVYDALEAFLTSFSDETPSRLSTTAA